MGDTEKPVEQRESPGPGPRTPRHPGPEEEHRPPAEEEAPDSPFPYADRFGDWVEDEASDERERPDG